MTSSLINLYKCVLVSRANVYMGEDGSIIFATWIEQTKGAFKRLGEDDPRRIKKLGFEIKPGFLKERRMM